MSRPDSPGESNDFLAEHVKLLQDSYRLWTGRELTPQSLKGGGDAARYLFHAPFAVVSHDTAADPVFNYGNAKALELFEMTWEAFTALPSRMSAEAVNRERRQELLEAVTEKGFVDDYSGIRISSSGRRFEIRDATVWNLVDTSGKPVGQAAMFSHWTFV